jgi:chromosome segregation ATPase
LEGQPQERHDRLDQLSSERKWHRDQYDALDALVEVVQTDNGWLEYQIEAMRDELLEQDSRAAEDASAITKVRTALLERDEALRKACEDLAGARTVAVEWETEVATTRAQLQQDRATLEGGVLGRARPRRRPRRLRS